MQNWYRQIQADSNWNWGQFNRTLIGTLGLGGAALLLVIYFGMSPQQAKQMVEQDPDQAEAQLQQIPAEVIQQAQQTSPIAPSPPAIEQPETKQLQEVLTYPLVSIEEMAEFIGANEGFEPYSYQDTPENRSIGFGFNLNRPDAKQLIEGLGHNFANIVNGSEAITRADATYLKNYVIKESMDTANDFSGGLSNHPPVVQQVVIDMAYNLGRPRLMGFTNYSKALHQRDYAWAAEEMMDSKWFRENQTGERDNMLVEMMQSAQIN